MSSIDAAPEAPPTVRPSREWAQLAFAVAMALAFLLRGRTALFENPALRDWSTLFVSVCVQALPFLVLGVTISGLIGAFVSPELVERFVPKRPVLALPSAGLAGFALPGCECGSVPIAGRLVAAGNDGAVLTSAGDGVWTTLDCPVRSGFQALLPLGEDEVLLAGGRYFIDANGFRGDLLRWRAGMFEKIEADEPLARLRALAAYRDGALAVGDQGRIYFIKGNRIDRLESATRHDLMGIAPLPTGEALAVGDFGTVLTAASDVQQVLAAPASISGEDTPSWECMESGVDRQLWGLWNDERDGMLYACGEEGTVLRFDGERLGQQLFRVVDLDVALTASSDGGLLAAGQLGEIHHFDGERWRKQFDLHVDITILSFWAESSEKIFAVGDEGLVLHWDGETWERMTSGTRSALYGLWGQDAEHLLAVGDFGMILRWNGKRWDEFHAGTENFLFDVWGNGLDDIYVVGLSGTIGHFDGRQWTLTPARARSDLLAVDGGDQGVFAVGAGGIAFRHDGRTWQTDVTGTDSGLRALSAGSSHGVLAAGDGGTIVRRRTL